MGREYTLVLIKPDALLKNLTGEILSRFSAQAFDILAMKCARVTREQAEEHYRYLKEAPFFEDLIQSFTGEYHQRRKIVAVVYGAADVLDRTRKIIGATNPEEAEPGTIRGTYGRITTAGLFENAVHASDTAADAEREIKLWFQPDEIIEDIYPTKVLQETNTRRAWN